MTNLFTITALVSKLNQMSWGEKEIMGDGGHWLLKLFSQMSQNN
jgi:hypothetical protein